MSLSPMNLLDKICVFILTGIFLGFLVASVAMQISAILDRGQQRPTRKGLATQPPPVMSAPAAAKWLLMLASGLWLSIDVREGGESALSLGGCAVFLAMAIVAYLLENEGRR